MAATKRDDEAHMKYLKEDIKYDNKHGHSDIDMTADEKHISKLAGDLKYDEKHHGAAQHHHGDIKEAPSKITQFFRGVKYDTSGPKNFLKNIATAAAIVAPIPSLGKIKAVKNIGTAIASNAKYIKKFGIDKDLFRSAGAISNDLAKPISASMQKALNANIPKSTSQNLKEAFSYPREALSAWPKSDIKNIASAFGNTSKQYLRGKNMTKIPNPIPESTKTYNKLQYPMGKDAFNNKTIGGFREFANRDLRDHFNKVPTSKPVNFKGPNPANNIGAGGNSYPR